MAQRPVVSSPLPGRSERPESGCASRRPWPGCGKTGRIGPWRSSVCRWGRRSPRPAGRGRVGRSPGRCAMPPPWSRCFSSRDVVRSPRGAHPAPGPDREQAPAAAGRTGPRQGQEGPHGPAGQGNPGHRGPPRHRRQDPAQDRCRGARRPGRGRGEDEEGHRRAQGPGQGPRLTADGPARCRPRGRRPDPGRRRRHRQVRRPQPVRLVDRHRTWTPHRAGRTVIGFLGPGTAG